MPGEIAQLSLDLSTEIVIRCRVVSGIFNPIPGEDMPVSVVREAIACYSAQSIAQRNQLSNVFQWNEKTWTCLGMAALRSLYIQIAEVIESEAGIEFQGKTYSLGDRLWVEIY